MSRNLRPLANGMQRVGALPRSRSGLKIEADDYSLKAEEVGRAMPPPAQ